VDGVKDTLVPPTHNNWEMMFDSVSESLETITQFNIQLFLKL
jgi:hypothetical protein